VGRVGAAVKELARRGGKLAFAAADVAYGAVPGPRILIYHQIDAGLGRQMEVTRDAFVAQLEWMQAHGDVVSLEQAILRRAEPGADRLFVITFDDGYDDFYRLGFPELERRGLPFVLYLTTHPVESGEPLKDGGGAEPLTWGQVDKMAASGLMTLGAHTHHHLDFRSISTAQVVDELDSSNELIERRMGVTPQHFAYPWGYWSEQGADAVASRYATATLGSGAAVTADRDLLLLNRIPVQLSDGVYFFTRKMRSGMRLEDVVRRRLTGYTGP
jgi:peptidoglycan/xylan/chitin deacetylase (PgdA/CDA1 family)